MRRKLLPRSIVAVLCAMLLSAAALEHTHAALPGPNAPASFADLAQRLLPAVVNISSTSMESEDQADQDDDEDNGDQGNLPPGLQDFFQQYMQHYSQNNAQTGQAQKTPQKVPMSSLGSGFVIDAAKGYIVTNSHVVKDATDVKVTFHDDSSLDAEVVGKDEKMDLAVLRVKTEGKHLVQAPFGDSDRQRVGDWVLAIGNPFGLGGTVTAGIISAQQRDIEAGPYDDFIQTDASINRGNSGGPMFNMNGEVIGINTAIFSPTGGSVGIGFAIPSNLATTVIAQLIQYGHTRRGWLGVRIQGVTDELAEGLGKGAPHGALVAGVTAGGPADKAGLKLGDIITGFNGHPVAEMHQLPRIVAETLIGSHAPLTYWRNGQNLTASVDVGELEKAEKDGLVTASTEGQTPSNPPKGVELKAVGMTLGAPTAAERDQYKIGATDTGVLVRDVDQAGEAGMKGLSPGDMITEVNQVPVKTPAEVAAAFSKAQSEGRNSILLLVTRESDVRFVALKLKGAPKAPSPPQAMPAPKTPSDKISPGLAAPGQALPGQPAPAPIKP